MQTRLHGLQRIALMYMAVKHAQALSLEQAAAALREAESQIEQQKAQALRSCVGGKVALDAGDHVGWKMHELQKQFTQWNAEGLAELRARRELLMLEAAEVYRAGRMQFEQVESVLRELRSEVELKRAHRAQRASDDRFLARQWWDARLVPDAGLDEERRMKGG